MEIEQPKKSFLRRFWWLLLIVIIILIPTVFFSYNYLTGGALKIKAQFAPPTKSGFYNNAPTIVNDYLYIGTSINTSLPPEKDNFFFKLDLDLKEIWQYKIPEYQEVQGGAALDSKGNIYFIVSARNASSKFSDQTCELYSLNNDGKFRWKKTISSEGQIFESGNSAPSVSVDDTIYVGDSKLFAFSADGSPKWFYPANNEVFTGFRSSPIIDKLGNIYIVAPNPQMQEQQRTVNAYKFTPNGNGVPAWSVQITNNDLTMDGDKEARGGAQVVNPTPAFSADQKILYGAVGNTINAINVETGKLIWSYKPDGIVGNFEASPAVDDQNNVYIGTKANAKSVLYAIRSDGKGLLWQKLVGGDLYGSPSLGDGGVIYQTSEYTGNTGTFHAIDMKTGEYKWNINIIYGLKDFQKTSPAIYKGYAYAGVMYKDFFGPLLKIKIDSQDYLSNAAWPRFHGGNANNGRKE